MKKRFTEEQIIGVLREAEVDGKDLELEIARLKKIVAGQMLAIEGLKEIAAKNVWPVPHLQGSLQLT